MLVRIRSVISVGVICDCFRALNEIKLQKRIIDVSDNFLFWQKDCSYWITSACQMSLAHFFEISTSWNQSIVEHTSSKTKYCYWYNSRNLHLKTLNQWQVIVIGNSQMQPNRNLGFWKQKLLKDSRLTVWIALTSAEQMIRVQFLAVPITFKI